VLDIDECTDGTHKCDINGAVCINTLGSHNCTCKNGFVGDGRNCTGKLYIDRIDRRVFQLRCMLCYSDVLSTLFENSTVRSAVHTNLSGTAELYENALQTRNI